MISAPNTAPGVDRETLRREASLELSSPGKGKEGIRPSVSGSLKGDARKEGRSADPPF